MVPELKYIKHVILDLDQTLTVDQGSWLQFTELLGADPKIHQDIFESYKAGRLEYPDAKRKLIELWRTVYPLDREGIAAIFARIRMREGAVEAVRYLQAKYEICIISGAIDLFVETVARKLGIDNYYASTRFEFNDQDILVDFHYKLSRGEEKLTFFEEYLQKSGADTSECCAIGDGDSDMPIFEKVRLPILFIAAETTKENKEKIKQHLVSWRDIEGVL